MIVAKEKSKIITIETFSIVLAFRRANYIRERAKRLVIWQEMKTSGIFLETPEVLSHKVQGTRDRKGPRLKAQGTRTSTRIRMTFLQSSIWWQMLFLYD